MKNKVIETKIDSLIPDDQNANKGTEYGNKLIEKSLQKFGAGRSILLDKNNKIIAGNKTIENAGSIGLENVIIVETAGDQIVAVKRTDIDIDSTIGRELALADNASAKANISWDTDVIEKLQGNWEIDVKDWGVANWDAGHEANNMTDEDVDINEEFDLVGIKSDKFKLGLLFENKDDCETFISKNKIDVNRKGQIWTALINSQSI